MDRSIFTVSTFAFLLAFCQPGQGQPAPLLEKGKELKVGEGNQGQMVKLVAGLNPAGWRASEVRQGTDKGDTGLAATYRGVLAEYGMNGYLMRFFQRGQRRVYIYVYKFPDASGAFGAYTVMRQGSSTVITRGGASSEDDQSISFWKNRFFVQVYTTAEDDDEAKELVTDIADHIENAVTASSTVPAIMSSLPRLDLIKGSEKYFLGPVSARRSSNIPYLGLLDIAKSTGACSADYRMQVPRPERLKLFVVDYRAPQKAYSIFRAYTDAIEQEHKGEVTGGTALFKLGRSYIYCRVQGSRLAIITGAKKKMSSRVLARQLGS